MFVRIGAALLLPFICVAAASAETNASSIRFFDSATGYVIPSGDIQVAPPSRPASTSLITVRHPKYRPLSFPTASERDHNIAVWLDPVETPPQVAPTRIRALQRADAMVILGFVAGEDSRGLEGVRVRTASEETYTDNQGFFQLVLPLHRTSAGRATLVFEKRGFVRHEIRSVDCWPNGDWTYQVQLKPGEGIEIVDEGSNRRLTPTPPQLPQSQIAETPSASLQLQSQPPTNVTVRVPTTIRVLRSNVIDYVSLELYTRRSLPREWIASWNGYTGGSNSLKAGAVAVRTYAVGYVNTPRGSDYDICATTSCQVYGTTTSTSTDNAVNQTAGFVMINSSGGIPRGLTEYSSENNSIGFSCGDGYTQPGSCLYDPVCTGEPRFGHGRGMCQWGSVKWATGLKFPGNDFSDTTTLNGQPRRDWIWILDHYYPDLRLVQGAELVISDDVRVSGTNSLMVRLCSDGGIADGVGCPLITTKPSGATGTIIDGPIQIITDGFGFSWWKVQWSDGIVGWSPENWLQRIIPLPPAPTNLVAASTSPTTAQLTWADASTLELGFEVEQSGSGGGPWNVIAQVAADVNSMIVSNLTPNTGYYFRVRAFNGGGESPPSTVASIMTSNNGLALSPIADQTINEGTQLTITAVASAPDEVTTLADFESFPPNTGNGGVLFRAPRLSGSTSALLELAPDVAIVTDSFPTNLSSRALAVRWSYADTTAPWLRLTTFNSANIPNPVINLGSRLQFDMHTDRDLKVAVGIRETTTPSGTPLGENGGSVGSIEWAGVTNKNGSQPIPARTVSAGAWQRLSFNLEAEPILSFSGGNGVLSTASGLAVLEHLALVPATGTGVHNIYLDNFSVVRPRHIFYSLDTGPTGAVMDTNTGVFIWTPSEAQGPGLYNVTVRATDNSNPPQSATRTFAITVREINRAPVLAAIPDYTIHAGMTLVFTNTCIDDDLPTNGVNYALLNTPIPGASISGPTGRFVFAPAASQANTTNRFIVRVMDNGSPPLSTSNTFTVVVLPPPIARATLSQSNGAELRWSAIPGRRYVVQYKNDLADPDWILIGPPITATSFELEFHENPTMPQRFYRIQVVQD